MSKVRENVIEAMRSLKDLIVGYDDLVRLLFVAALTRGNILIEGPPGTGKTTAAKLFAEMFGGTFKRVQMTPDLLPSDIIGSYYFDLRKGEWVLRKGPLFANVVLVDELNRAPPRTQSALLEAMQERQVSIDGVVHHLPEVFMVVATQMPTGAEGTYPLTPVLVDRFSYYYVTRYFNDEEVERAIVLKAEEIEGSSGRNSFSLELLEEASKEVSKVYVSDKVLRYIVRLVTFIRGREEVLIPPSPRASIWLYRGSKAMAYLDGSDYVVPDHVKWLARYVLTHRIHLKPEYQAEGVKPADLVEQAIRSVEVPK
jgi:MoxR-like ATPase